MEMAATPAKAENPEDRVSESGEKKPNQWEIDNWVRTVMEAEEIRDDPEKMRYVTPLLHKKASSAQKAVRSIGDLRKLADKKAKGKKVEVEDEDMDD